MKFRIEIDTDNAAFGETEEDRAEEISRILNQISVKLAQAPTRNSWSAIDRNGNFLGWAELVEEVVDTDS